jgi:hypothetical protein
MKIKIYYNKNYIPFDLYINSIYNIFKTNSYFTSNNYEVSIIKNIYELSEETDVLIMYLNYIKDIYNVNTNTTKIIFIHADYILNHSKEDQNLMINYINNINLNNTYLWEYSYLNIEYYKQNFRNSKIYFLPLLYNTYLETIYNSCKLNIDYKNKPIDILFMGASDQGSRRQNLLNKIPKKYNLYIMNNVNNINQYINIVEQSKIVLQIYSKEVNKPFDYYRLALLYSNKVIVINEKHEENITENSNLYELNTVIVQCNYDNIINTIDFYLSQQENAINNLSFEAYKIFKKNTMDDKLVNFFSNI